MFMLGLIFAGLISAIRFLFYKIAEYVSAHPIFAISLAMIVVIFIYAKHM